MVHSLQSVIDAALAKVPQQAKPRNEVIHVVPLQEEEHRERMLNYLQSRTMPNMPNRLHIGIAGFHNFATAAVSRPDGILLLDANANQETFWREIIRMLQENKTPAGFIDAYASRMKPMYIGERFMAPENAWLKLRIDGSVSVDYLKNERVAGWLQREPYERLRQLALDGKIATATVDLTADDKRAQAMGGALQKAGWHTDTCYWSNLLHFLRPWRGKWCSSSTDSVFGNVPDKNKETGLNYPDKDFFQRMEHAPDRRWSADDVSARGAGSRSSPLFEHFLRNISRIAGPKGTHFMLESTGLDDMVVTEGPPRNMLYLARKEAHEAAARRHAP